MGRVEGPSLYRRWCTPECNVQSLTPFWPLYGFRLFRDRVRAKVQFNVRDVLENGRLQKVAINPDGSTYAYRIIDPRQFILSTSFDL